jgi:hypothetical protein
LFCPQNAKKREALDAAQAKKKNANFSAVIPDRDWTEEEKQVRQREKQIEGKRERERERENPQYDCTAHIQEHTACQLPLLPCTALPMMRTSES